VKTSSEEDRIVLRDTAFHDQVGDPANLKLCDRGLWNTRMLVETALSILNGVCQLKKGVHRTWVAFQMRRAFTLATCNLLVSGADSNPMLMGSFSSRWPSLVCNQLAISFASSCG
jgi:hypothetical protein